MGIPVRFNHGSQMRFEKEIIQKSVRILVDKAKRCFDLARYQHISADKQNANADQLEALGQNAHINADGIEALGRIGHVNADNEHASAEKLVTLGQSLEAEASQLNGEIEMITGRTSPILRTLPADLQESNGLTRDPASPVRKYSAR
jgi:hypothetical protein